MASSLSMGRGPDSDKGPHVLPSLSAPIHHFRKTVSFVHDGHGGYLCSAVGRSTQPTSSVVLEKLLSLQLAKVADGSRS